MSTSTLSKFPGPKLHAAFELPHLLSQYRGELEEDIRKMHEQYGPVVRISTHQLSFSTAAAHKGM